MRSTLVVLTSVMGVAVPSATATADVREVRPGAAVLVPDAPERGAADVARGSWNSEIVPHWPHSGQRPYHLTPFQPHSEQTY